METEATAQNNQQMQSTVEEKKPETPESDWDIPAFLRQRN